MRPKLKITTIRGFSKPTYQYIFTLGSVFYIGARMKTDRWNYQIGVANDNWIMPHLIFTMKSRPLITNLYIIAVGLFFIYIPYYIVMNFLVLIVGLFKLFIQWIFEPKREIAYWTTLFWFTVAFVFVTLYIFK